MAEYDMLMATEGYEGFKDDFDRKVRVLTAKTKLAGEDINLVNTKLGTIQSLNRRWFGDPLANGDSAGPLPGSVDRPRGRRRRGDPGKLRQLSGSASVGHHVRVQRRRHDHARLEFLAESGGIWTDLNAANQNRCRCPAPAGYQFAKSLT